MSGLLKEFAGYVIRRKKYWLVPLILAIILVGTLVIVASSSSVSPFIYALF